MRAAFLRIALATVAAIAICGGATAEPAASIAIAVAPFEYSVPPGGEALDVETLLADRLGTKGVKKVVGPAELAVAADAEPTAETVQTLARQAGVAAVVVGRVTQIGGQVSVDVRLRSGETGAAAGTYVAEALRADQLEAVVDRLASQLIDGAAALGPEPAPAVSAGTPASSPSAGAAFGISFDSGGPISIHSDELESVKSAGMRHLLFSKNVVVTQDDLTIRSNRLEAFYPPKASEPDRLVATGRVRMLNGENEVSCDKATYERTKDLLICRGSAELREGPDCVAGKWIEFDLAAETVKVGGGAKVVIGETNGASAGGVCR